MKKTYLYGLVITSLVASALLSGCEVEDNTPDAPSSTTVIHDKSAPAPDVNVVTPPASSSTSTNTTTTVPTDSGASSTTTSTTKSGG